MGKNAKQAGMAQGNACRVAACHACQITSPDCHPFLLMLPLTLQCQRVLKVQWKLWVPAPDVPTAVLQRDLCYVSSETGCPSAAEQRKLS